MDWIAYFQLVDEEEAKIIDDAGKKAKSANAQPLDESKLRLG